MLTEKTITVAEVDRIRSEARAEKAKQLQEAVKAARRTAEEAYQSILRIWPDLVRQAAADLDADAVVVALARTDGQNVDLCHSLAVKVREAGFEANFVKLSGIQPNTINRAWIGGRDLHIKYPAGGVYALNTEYDGPTSSGGFLIVVFPEK